MKDVTILTTNTCPYCKMAKDFLIQNKIHFIEKDVNVDPQARHEMTSRNITGVPTFLIGNDVVVGLDKMKILELVDHRLVKCPNCNTTIRVPTNEGRISARCPKCKSNLNV
ncbi:glutaredoxin family protein [Sinanaerobacter chloroacetimidivorans]|jgi:glutaredoxin 3|uniref:Glutaredoxin family protein n=1 Tax=Sinanaerobacter chloroacetimidivorans TaxID=2818044 RepID=A0A8J8B0I9_9FIRM|nr:glutaredoxin family protein [Sinanaerobacter chloroacetimidivorans]MBR0596681.1 glutaredoxin family protein [Sinanaerobacter chloroacetimidivorans]